MRLRLYWIHRSPSNRFAPGAQMRCDACGNQNDMKRGAEATNPVPREPLYSSRLHNPIGCETESANGTRAPLTYTKIRTRRRLNDISTDNIMQEKKSFVHQIKFSHFPATCGKHTHSPIYEWQNGTMASETKPCVVFLSLLSPYLSKIMELN